MKTWYQMTAEEALRGMESSHGGLSSGQAEVRCGQFGENVLQEHAGKKIWQEFLFFLAVGRVRLLFLR